MNTAVTWPVLLTFGLIGSLAGCSPDTMSRDKDALANVSSTVPAAAGRAAAVSGGAASAAASGAASRSGAASAASGMSGAGSVTAAAGSKAPTTTPPSGACAATDKTSKEVGCPCRANETAACWTGPFADRNVGACHDGLQVCEGAEDNEFRTWGPCMGEELSCGTDGGVPPPPPPETECGCIPGAVIQCSEDCSVGIICSLTATKSCQPDGTWSVCREDASAVVDVPGVQCRNMLHGCFDTSNPTMPAQDGEIYVGDCSKQFKCGHSPQPVGAAQTSMPQ